MARERILLMGGPGTGKTFHLIKCVEMFKEMGKASYLMDCEDKMLAFIEGLGLKTNPGKSKVGEVEVPFDFVPELNATIYVAFTYEEMDAATRDIASKAKPNELIGVDRVDLTWPAVQRYYTQLKYQESLAQRLVEQAAKIKKSTRFIPRFDQGDWQPVNETYDSLIGRIIYRQRCHILLTTGIRGLDENSARQDIFDVGVLPRGQKELPHQPNGVFLFEVERKGSERNFYITTCKDVIGRPYFETRGPIYDFSLQYLSRYIKE